MHHYEPKMMKWKIRSQLNPGRLFGIVIHQPRSQSTSRTAVPPVISTVFPALWLAVSNIFFFLIDCWHNLDFFFSFVSLSIKMQKLSKYPQSCLSPFSGAGSDEASFSLWLICCTLWKTIAHKLLIDSPIPPTHLLLKKTFDSTLDHATGQIQQGGNPNPFTRKYARIVFA